MPNRLSAAEKVRRDAQIIGDRARGLRWSTIAQRYQLSERHAREIWRERLAAEPLESVDGNGALTEALLQIETTIEDLALLAEATNNDPVKLGAIRARVAAMAQRNDLLRLAGYLPFSPRDAYTEADMRRMSDALIRVFEKHQPSDEILADLEEALGVPAGRSNGRHG